MTAILTLIVLIAIGYIGSRILLVKAKLPLETQYFFLTGGEYIFIGVLLGPHFLNLINNQTITQLNPILSLGIGWIGLVFGLQFQWRRLKRIPFSYFSIALIEGITTFVLVLLTFLLVFRYLLPNENSSYNIQTMSILLASIASLTSPTCLGLVVKHFSPQGENTRLLKFISGVDSIIGLVIFGLIFVFFHISGSDGDYLLPSWQWLLLSVGLGVVQGILFYRLIAHRFKKIETIILTIGMVIFSSGLAGYLHLSPLFVNFILGITLANLPSLNRDKIHDTLLSVEKPFYILLLILAGSIWKIEIVFALPLIILYFLVRTLGKYLGVQLALSVNKLPFNPPKELGLSLLSHGGIAIAMLINYHQVYELAGWMMTIILVNTILNQLLSPRMIKMVLTKAGEI